MKKRRKKVSHFKAVMALHEKRSPDLLFWLEHIVHWHLLLIVMIVFSAMLMGQLF
ncbi:hypothetical protein KKD42_00020 [Patescibacteria group bacterium]|nr:hypothetical protein [Patescibacteria group bacterium]